MGSLFLRVFFTFWVATVLIGACLVAVTLTTDPRRADFARHESRMRSLGEELVAVYEQGGLDALRRAPVPRDPRGTPSALLFDAGARPLSAQRVPRPAARLAARAAATGEPETHATRHGLWLALPLEGGYQLVSRVAPPTPLERFLDPSRLTLRLGIAFAITGLVSWFLARSLSRPLRELRRATQQLAAGDLSARVGAGGGRRRDETAELGRDFDRMAERIAQLVESQQRLLRDVSHELRSPLARLNVALELARQRAGEAAAPLLDRIGREAERLNELIGQLLTLTALEDGEGRARFAPLDLTALVQEVVRDAAFEAQARDCSVQVTAAESVTLRGAGELLARAVENVVRNALHFTAPGSTVEVAATRSGGRARVTVRDHGPGVPEASLPLLFRPFYRVAEARDRRSGGTGIGLAISERAVRLHDGTVRAENHPDGGLVVTLDLPLAEPAETAPRVSAST